jgi:SAM-dependent methyltransferase
METPVYNDQFFRELQAGAIRSAREIVPLIMELLHPSSILDVGCGNGTWLSVFSEHGVRDFLGVDGDYVRRDMLLIPTERFSAQDLERSFDLALSVEVGEHLNAAVAQSFVDSLVRHAPAVFFSAAVPFQGGGHHVNEQWPEYWSRLFEARGYLPVDCIRPTVWTNDKVEWWYAQNMLLFAQRTYIEARPVLRTAFDRTHPRALSIVHPRNYLSKAVQAKSLNRENVSQLVSHAFALGSKALRRIFER